MTNLLTDTIFVLVSRYFKVHFLQEPYQDIFLEYAESLWIYLSFHSHFYANPAT